MYGENTSLHSYLLIAGKHVSADQELIQITFCGEALEWLHSIENQNAICLFNGRDYVASCFVQGVSVTFSVHVAFSSRIVMCLLTPVGNMYQT